MTTLSLVSKQTQSLLVSALQVCGGALLLALCAQIHIPLWFTPVLISGHTFAVMLLGALLGSRRGVAAVSLYMAAIVMGLPVLSGCYANSAMLIGAKGGYYIGMLFQAYLVGWFVEKGNMTRAKLMAVLLASCAVQLSLGLLMLAHFVGWNNVLLMGLYPFIPGELLKCIGIVSLLKK